MSEQDRIAEARRKLLEKRLKGKKQQDQQELPTITRKPDDTQARASMGQARLWVLQQLQSDSVAYNLPNIVRIEGDLDIDRLEEGIQQIIQRHQALRTRFIMRDGQLLQDVQDNVEFHLERQSVQSEEELNQQVKSCLQESFDLAQSPLIRGHLLTVTDHEHVLVTVIHHIVSDEWSVDLFWKELSIFYREQSTDLSPLPIQYQDYAYWQHQQTYEAQLDYWRETLSGDLPLLQLPHDKPRPSVQTFKGHFRTYRLSKELSSALQTLSTQSHTTLFVTLLSAFNILLHRYTGQDDVLVGTPITNRKYPEIESLIGFFVNTIVVRSQLDDDVSFAAYLNTIRQQALNAIRNGDIPFDRVVDDINPKRDPAYNPIFQVMLVFQDEQAHQPTLDDLSLQTMTVDYGVSKFDMTLFAQVKDSQIELSLEYSSDLFEETQIVRFLEHYEHLLQSIVDAPQALISQLSLLPEAERAQILALSQGAVIDYPHDILIQDLIAHHPEDTLAIQSATGSLTYGDLNQRANQLAHHLLERGVTKNIPVGVCVERSPEMLIAILGVLKAGGAYVPIDPDYPQDRISYMLEDAGIDIVVTHQPVLSTLDSSARLVVLDEADIIAQESSEPPAITTSADDLAYIIYTSGSTGKPKGVRVTHRNLVHSTTARDTFYPDAVDRFLLLSSYAFDSSIVGIFWTLCSGGTLCLPAHQGERDIKQITQLIADYDVSHLLVLPSLYQIILEFAQPSQLQSLNTVIVAGEACAVPLVNKHYQQIPDCTLYNEYGPTEATVWCTAWHIPQNAETVLIGKPIANTQTYVLDKHQNIVPTGIVGELYIGGEGISKGYHNRPELMAERFVDNPFADGSLYRTGDLARFRPDGNLDFLGRVDFQVKISGYRIELGEIETTLMQNPAIQEAIVLPVSSVVVQLSDTEQLLHKIGHQLQSQDTEQLLAEIEQLSDNDVAMILKNLTGDSNYDT